MIARLRKRARPFKFARARMVRVTCELLRCWLEAERGIEETLWKK